MSFALHPESVYTGAVSRSCEAGRLADAKRFLKLMDHPRMVIRTLPDSREVYGEWSDIDEFAPAVIRLSHAPDVPYSAAGVYLVINPTFEQAFLNFANGHGDGKAVADRHIERRTDLYIDVDPTRFHPDGGKISASAAERDWAEATMERVVMIAAFHGFSEPVVVDSGNGFQVHFKIDLPNDDESKLLVKGVLKTFADMIDSERGHIDTTVNNAARLARMPGTYNRKGSHSDERPHRLASIVSAPESGVMEVTGGDTLRRFVATHGSASTKCQASNNELPEITPALREQLVDELVAYFQLNGAPPVTHVTESEEKTVIHFGYCPFRGPEHADGDPSVLLWKSGAVSFHCFHSKCAEANWSKLQRKLGPLFHSDSLIAFADDNRDRIHREYNDPYWLSQHHLEKTRLAGGENSLVYIGGQMYHYTDDHAWQPVVKGELDAPVRRSIQSAFDAYYMMNPGMPKAPKVVSATITNAIKAVESAVHFPTDPMQTPPFWLSERPESNPLNLVIAKNGIIDVLAYAQGKPFFFDRTPELFSTSNGAFNYVEGCVEAPAWFGFINSLEQPEEWVQLLQEIMGYCLAGGYDLQKVIMFLGPPRCGKGTVQRTISKLLGIGNVCSPNIEDFASAFGMEQMLGKRLAIVPEAQLPPRDVPQIVASVKAISGGDMVTVNRKHLKNIPVTLTTKIMMVSNNMLVLPDNSKALSVRIVPLRFREEFVGREDIKLASKLTQELPGIFNWALPGLRRLYINDGKFTLPASSIEIMEQLTMESAPLQSFLHDLCTFDVRKAIYKPSLYEHYKTWSKVQDSERAILSVADFGRELMTAAPQVSAKRTSNRDLHQGSYQVMPSPYDYKATADRPEVWVGVYCRVDN
jgi:putative DNA primase/helicase